MIPILDFLILQDRISHQNIYCESHKLSDTRICISETKYSLFRGAFSYNKVTSLSSLPCTFQTHAYSHFLQLPLATSNSMTVYSVHIVCTFVSRPLTQTLTLILTCLAPLSLNCSTTMCSVFPFVLYLCLILFLSTCLVPLSCSSKNWLLLIHMRHIVSCTFDSYDFSFILHLDSCLARLMLNTDAFVCLAHLSFSLVCFVHFFYSVQSW